MNINNVIKLTFNSRHRSTNEKNIEKDKLYLIKKAMKGDKNAFKEEIDKHKSYLYKTAFLYVKNENEALEIYQKTIYKAFIAIGKLKRPEYFKTWITKILINNVNDYLKENKKYVAMEDNVEDINCSKDTISVEEKMDLYDAIDSLSSDKKTAIILKYFHGFEVSEIAKLMECSENTIKSHIRRGKLYMKKYLDGGNLYE